MNAVCAYLPSPVDTPAIIGHDPNDPDKEISRKPSSEEPMAALAFKIAVDPYVGTSLFLPCLFWRNPGRIVCVEYSFG